MNLVELLDTKKASLDKNGIWATSPELSREEKLSKQRWEGLYDFGIEELKRQRDVFDRDKLNDHLKFILPSFNFGRETIYLEIGCGPAHIGDYLQAERGCQFIGLDFNYQALVVLKAYFEEKGYKDYLLIHADIKDIPLKDKSVDFIYGGGVIEHTKNTGVVLRELSRVLKTGGVSFNTVPAFNFFWLTRFYKSIPNVPVLRPVLDFVHLKLLRGKVLGRNFGYELSFTLEGVKKLHREAGFAKVAAGPFAFHPNPEKLKPAFLGAVYFGLSHSAWFCPFCFVKARK